MILKDVSSFPGAYTCTHLKIRYKFKHSKKLKTIYHLLMHKPQEQLRFSAKDVGVEGQVVDSQVHPALRRQTAFPPRTRIVAHLFKV
jgi:hypothetical protein